MLNQVNVTTGPQFKNREIKRNLINNGNVFSIVGPSFKGKSFVPIGINSYSQNTQNDLLDFESNIGTLKENYDKFEGKINSILSSYVAIDNGSQVNYTRLLGIKNSKIQGNPGFNLEDSFFGKTYLLSIQQRRNTNLNRYNNFITNYENFGLTSQPVQHYECLLGIFVTINGVTLNFNNTTGITPDLNGNYILNLITSDETFIDNSSNIIDQSTNLKKPIPVKNKFIKINFKKDDAFFWKKQLNLNPSRIKEFGYVLLNSQETNNSFSGALSPINNKNSNNTGNQIPNTGGNLKVHNITTPTGYLNFNLQKTVSTSPWFISQGFYSNQKTIKRENILLNSSAIDLFRFHAIHEGEVGNNIIISILPKSLGKNQTYSKFDIEIYDKKDIKKPLEVYLDCTLDENDENFILRKIGDMNEYFDHEGSERIVIEGSYYNQSKYVRIELSEDVILQNIPVETIPVGYREKEKIKRSIFGKTLNIENNYIIHPVFDLDNNSNISEYHSWGQCFLNIKDPNSIKNGIPSFKYIKKDGNISESIETNSDTNSIKYLKYDTIPNEAYIDKEDNTFLLNSNYIVKNNNVFSLEKIILIDEKDTQNNKRKARWDLSSFDLKGLLLTEIESQPLFSDRKLYHNSITGINEVTNISNISGINNPFYYFNVGFENFDLDDTSKLESTIEKANEEYPGILRFSTLMTGGFDGLNMFDSDIFSLTTKGIQKSDYVKDLYKYSIDITKEKENGLNDIIYMPVFNQELIDYSINGNINEYNRIQPVYFWDYPLYKNDGTILHHEDLLKKKEDPLLNWSDFIYEYLQNKDFDIETTYDQWDNLNIKNKYCVSFSNYVNIKINNFENLNAGLSYNLIIPSGMIAIIQAAKIKNEISPFSKAINHEDLNIDYLDKSKNIAIAENIVIQFDEKNYPGRNKRYEKTKCNIFFKKSSMADTNNASNNFLTQRTMNYEKNAQISIYDNLQYRLIWQSIKREMEDILNRQLFERKNSKELIQYYKNSVNIVMQKYVNNGLIEKFDIEMDEKINSEDQILNGLIKGKVNLKFINQDKYYDQISSIIL